MEVMHGWLVGTEAKGFIKSKYTWKLIVRDNECIVFNLN